MNKKNNFYTGKQVKDQFHVCTRTLQKWSDSGKVQTVRTPGGKRLYSLQDLEKLLSCNQQVARKKVCYARVSTEKQKDNLERQVQFLKEQYPDSQIITDIGSGLNWKRKGLQTLLDMCFEGLVGEVIVTYRDRLCRFSIELMEFIFEKTDTKLVVCNKSEEADVDELQSDLLSVVTVFAAKNNGRRSSKSKQSKKSENKTTTRQEIKEDSE